MSRRPEDASGFDRIDIVRAVAVMAALVVFVGMALEEGRGPVRFPEPVPTPGGEPIASEADVFRLDSRDMAVAPDYPGDTGAHVRSMEMHRRLRAYPGAPPRIPHGLTDDEFRQGTCSVCHQSGGWVARFGTYAPVTPHAELGACLQCHAVRDELVGRPLPDSERALVCTQCHVDPDRPPASFVDTDWVAATWPETGRRDLRDGPYPIPHRLQMRGNCLACHAGPGAVEALRTDHPERVSCRQCHVAASPEGGTS